MEHAQNYEIIRTQEGVLVFAIESKKTEPENPRIIYDGGRHATLYRRPDEVVLLDYLNEEILEELKKSEFVLITEADYKKEKIVRHYKARLRHVKNNPFCDNLS